MEYRRLGNSGLEVSAVGLGCNNFGMRADYPQSEGVVRKALDLGVTLFDTADVYGGAKSEEFLGKALGSDRNSVVVATKFSMQMGEGPMRKGTSRRYVMEAVEASLRRLGTNYIDLYQVHFPDAETPLEETMRALDDLVTAGKVRYVGNSNFAGWQIASGHWIAQLRGYVPFISAQNEYNVLKRDIEAEVVPACAAFGLGILPYFPLASGLLTGKYQRGVAAPEGTRLAAGRMAERVMTDRNWDIVEGLEKFAQERGHTLLELAFGWLASQPQVSSVIAGATRPEQVEQNAAAVAWQLSVEELAAVDEIAPR